MKTKQFLIINLMVLVFLCVPTSPFCSIVTNKFEMGKRFKVDVPIEVYFKFGLSLFESKDLTGYIQIKNNLNEVKKVFIYVILYDSSKQMVAAGSLVGLEVEPSKTQQIATSINFGVSKENIKKIKSFEMKAYIE